jgi:hypothetical protein
VRVEAVIVVNICPFLLTHNPNISSSSADVLSLYTPFVRDPLRPRAFTSSALASSLTSSFDAEDASPFGTGLDNFSWTGVDASSSEAMVEFGGNCCFEAAKMLGAPYSQYIWMT